MPEINFRRTPVTLALAAIVVAIEAATLFDENSAAQRRYYYHDLKLGLWLQIWQGELWRPFTSTLLHGGILHLVMNMTAMFGFGPVVENRLGPLKMLGLVILLAYTSMLSQYVLGNYWLAEGERAAGVVGLSGILFGLAGFMIVGRRYHADLALAMGPDAIRSIGFWFLFCVVLTYMGVMRIGNIAHAAGFIFGGLYGLAMFATQKRLLWITLSAAATAAILSLMIAAPGHPHYEFVKAVRQLS